MSTQWSQCKLLSLDFELILDGTFIQDVMHKVCESTGEVLRIVIFRRRGVKAMVEFANIEAANRAKEALFGADIYSGCCSLKIEYAKVRNKNFFKFIILSACSKTCLL